MSSPTIQREIQAGGTVVLRDERCTFTFAASPGTLEITIEGVDRGQFGSAALDEISRAIMRDRPIELFIDAAAASMPVVEVSREWTKFFALNQKDLKRVSVLVGSKAVELTVAIAQHLSRTGKLIQIYSDREVFEARKAPARR